MIGQKTTTTDGQDERTHRLYDNLSRQHKYESQ